MTRIFVVFFALLFGRTIAQDIPQKITSKSPGLDRCCSFVK